MTTPRGPRLPSTYRHRMPSVHDEAEHRAPRREPSVHDIVIEQEFQREKIEQLQGFIEEYKTGSHNIPPPAVTVALPAMPRAQPSLRPTSSPPWLRAADKKWRQITVAGLAIAATAVISVLATSAVKDCQAAIDRERLGPALSPSTR